MPPVFSYLELSQETFGHPLVKSLGPVDAEQDLHVWSAEIEGPADTPYEGGSFSLDIEFPKEYPFRPPKIQFATKIYHCNIHPETGRIALGILKDHWSPALSIRIVLSSICNMIAGEPEPSAYCSKPTCILCEISSILKRDRELYDSTAREWTRKYAMPSSSEQGEVVEEDSHQEEPPSS